ncbi:rhodanese-like domain-containing protein [Ornithinibacillus contaminans]|uniref:rhodanese-like domain-containing protein n=1 Tax=Ornithinibacillus contaminans TaxID=694055 RepID=UPI00064DDB67|nr:rhodanese-like domain-containing protein [Ornithinibacillus contaminans]
MDFREWIIIGLIVVFIVSRFIPVKGITNITTGEAKQKMDGKNIQFIDVRTPGEYNRDHQKPFRNIPLYELASRVRELDRSKEVVVICQSGIRSAKATRVLKRKGFDRIANVKGGMKALRKNESENEAAR